VETSGTTQRSIPSTIENFSSFCLAKGHFEMDPSTSRLSFLNEPAPDQVAGGLRENLARAFAQRSDAAYQVLNAQIGGAPRTFVAGSTQGPRGRQIVAGFEVDFLNLTQWFGTALNRQPLLPPFPGSRTSDERVSTCEHSRPRRSGTLPAGRRVTTKIDSHKALW
jgi:hypothetical protein